MNNLIEGVQLTPLKKIVDERGMLLHMMRSDFGQFKKFGEVYFSFTNPGVVKGWKRHLKMTQNFAVPVGEVKIVIFDSRISSSTHGNTFEVFLSSKNYKLLTIPPDLWYSFSTISDTVGMIANFADLIHTPNEVETCSLDSEDIPYNWKNN